MFAGSSIVVDESEQASADGDVGGRQAGVRQQAWLDRKQGDRQSSAPRPRDLASGAPSIEEKQPPEQQGSGTRGREQPTQVSSRIEPDAVDALPEVKRQRGDVDGKRHRAELEETVMTSRPPALQAAVDVDRFVASGSQRASRADAP